MNKLNKKNQEAIMDIRRYIGSVLFTAILFCVANFLGLMLSENSLIAMYFMVIWAGIFIGCLACIYRLSRLALIIFSRPDNY